jgi:hypothetical protein
MPVFSAILPAWARKSPQLAEVLPLLYLHGLSTGDFAPALEQFLGTSHGLSAATITRMTEQWKDDARAFAARSLAEVDYVYVWVDGIHLKGPPRAGQSVPAGDDRGAPTTLPARRSPSAPVRWSRCAARVGSRRRSSTW